MVICLIALVSLAVQYSLKIKQWVTFSGLIMLLFFVGGHWYYGHYLYWAHNGEGEDYPLYERTPFFRELLALTPHVEDNTLILLYECSPDTLSPAAYYSANDIFAGRYLYRFEDTHILTGLIYGNDYSAQGLTSEAFNTLPGSDPIALVKYGYDEMIVVSCTSDGLVIEPEFPQGFTPPDADLTRYNPFARIKDDFIDEDIARFLAY